MKVHSTTVATATQSHTADMMYGILANKLRQHQRGKSSIQTDGQVNRAGSGVQNTVWLYTGQYMLQVNALKPFSGVSV